MQSKYKPRQIQNLFLRIETVQNTLMRLREGTQNLLNSNNAYEKENYYWIFQCKCIVAEINRNISLKQSSNPNYAKHFESELKTIVQLSTEITMMLNMYEKEMIKRNNSNITQLRNEMFL
jgi:hypothetical protein